MNQHPTWADLTIAELAGELAYWTENPKLQGWEQTVEEIEAELRARDADRARLDAELAVFRGAFVALRSTSDDLARILQKLDDATKPAAAPGAR